METAVQSGTEHEVVRYGQPLQCEGAVRPNVRHLPLTSGSPASEWLPVNVLDPANDGEANELELQWLACRQLPGVGRHLQDDLGLFSRRIHRDG